MKKIFMVLLFAAAMVTVAGVNVAMPSNAKKYDFAVPTITVAPTLEVNYWEVFPVTIAYRGYYQGALRLLNVRKCMSITCDTVGYLMPFSVWQCDIARPEGQNIWCKLSSQGTTTRARDAYYVPLKYNGVYYTDWRE